MNCRDYDKPGSRSPCRSCAKLENWRPKIVPVCDCTTRGKRMRRLASVHFNPECFDVSDGAHITTVFWCSICGTVMRKEGRAPWKTFKPEYRVEGA